MKKIVSLTCLLALLSSCVHTPKPLMPYAGKPEEATNVCLSAEQGIIAVSEPVAVFNDDFNGSLAEKWQSPLNHANLVTFKTGKLDGKSAMIWINEQEADNAYDTETAIGTQPFSVAGLYDIQLTYAAKSTVGDVRRKSIIHYGNVDFMVCWYRNGEEKPFREDVFDCESSPDAFIANAHSFTVPAGAETATLHFGFGRPNFQKGQLFAIADLRVTGYGGGSAIVPSASFVTTPILLTGNDIRSNATIPKGTGLTFAFAYAADDNGVPGPWSDWTAPMGTKGKLNPPPNAAWVKCKATYTSDGKATAAVKSLTIGKRTIGNWSSIHAPVSPDVTIISTSPAKVEAPVIIKLTTQSEINWRTSQLLLDGTDITAQFTPLPSIGDGIFQYAPAEPFTQGVHAITAKLDTMDGATLNKQCIFYAGERRATSPQVTLRHDGMMLVDGKPFFPIGLYVLKKSKGNNNDFDTMFKDLRSRGFNFGREVGWFNNAEDARAFAAAAERNDYKVFMTAGFKGANTQDLSVVAHGIAALQDCKSILMWYLGDDTSQHNTTEMLRLKHETVKAIDPGRLTVQADCVGGAENSNYRPYVNGTDVFHPEVYPLRNQKPEQDHRGCVFKVIADTDCALNDIKLAAGGPRGVQPIIQFFGSKDTNYTAGWSFNQPGEVRAMSYATIIRGATGITWYCYGPMSQYITATTLPDRWEELTGVARELDSLQDVLTAEPIPQPAAPEIIKGRPLDNANRPPVYILLKRSEKRTVLMAVNASLDDVTARITLPGLNAATELFPTTDFPLAAPGVLEVPFTKFQVRVFELEIRK